MIGTALAVAPFNMVARMVGNDEDCPKVLINMTDTKDFMEFDDPFYPRRLMLRGKCDDIVKDLAKECGWENELNELCKNFKSKSIEIESLESYMESLTIEESKEDSK